MKVGLSTWSLLRSDLYTAVRTIGDAGLDYIELWGEVPHAYHQWADKKRLRDALSTYDFTITMHAPFTDLNPATPFDPVKSAVERTLKDFVRFAGDIGATRVTFHPGSVHNGALVQQSVHDAVNLLNKLVKEGAGAIIINVENQARTKSHYHFPVGGDAESIETLLTSVEGSSYTLDTGHAHVSGDDPLTYYERFRRSLTEVHLSDNDGVGDEHLLLGAGTAKLDVLLDKFSTLDVLLCLELNPFRYGENEVIQAANNLKKRYGLS